MATQTETVPGFQAGSWTIDPAHSYVSFTVRHMGVSKVRGTFDEVEGTIVTTENPLESKVTAVIKTASVNTRTQMRDDHVRGEDFLHAEANPTITFESTGIRPADDGMYYIDGNLTLRGVTRPVTLETEIGGFAPGMHEGSTIAGFSATTEISRGDFGVTGGAAGASVSDKIRITLDIEAVSA